MESINHALRLLIIDIDGLRQDVFHNALAQGNTPNLAKLLSGPGENIHLDPVSTAPSITFCAQSSIFTGEQPEVHGIVGNQFFDRHAVQGKGPRFYAFDVGDSLAYEDAVLTFSGEIGLLGQTLAPQAETIYEKASRRGLSSTVVYHMVSRGANRWIKPSLVDIARFTKGGGLVGLSAEQYDHEMMEKTLEHLRQGGHPDILTVYFMGLDHTSHQYGPGAQAGYLAKIVDPEVGRLAAELEKRSLLQNTLVAVVSDHGQIQVIPDDRHSLRLSFPFDREMGYLFDALGLDVHDKPGEGPACDAVLASNGGLAHVYLRRKSGEWKETPHFMEDVLPVASAFWEAHLTGRYAQDLQGALAMVLVRNVEQDGWQADYQALTPDGHLQDVHSYLEEHPEIQTVDAVARLRSLASPMCGDLLLVSNYAEGFYFGGIITGIHGGLHPQESLAVGSLGWIGASPEQWSHLQDVTKAAILERQETDGCEHASISDISRILAKMMDI
jgi:hypothetical protein